MDARQIWLSHSGQSRVSLEGQTRTDRRGAPFDEKFTARGPFGSTSDQGHTPNLAISIYCVNSGQSGGTDPAAGPAKRLQLGLFSHLKGVVDLNA